MGLCLKAAQCQFHHQSWGVLVTQLLFTHTMLDIPHFLLGCNVALKWGLSIFLF